MSDDIHIAHLNGVIDHLKRAISEAIRGYEQATEELGAEGDRLDADWSEPYNFLKARLAYFKSQR